MVTTQIAILLFMFYPKLFLSSATNLFLAQATSTAFASNATGFALRAVFPSFALSFLLFSLFLGLETNLTVSAAYVRNSGQTKYSKLIPAALFPFLRWFFVVSAINFCLMTFQGATLGIAGPVTPGSFLSDSLLQRVTIDNTVRFVALCGALLFIAVVMLPLPLFFGGLSERVVRIIVMSNGGKANRRPGSSPRRILRFIAFWTTIGVALICLTYHALLVGRLLGLLGSPFENRRPAFPPEFIFNIIVESLDYGVLGAIFGAVLAVIGWFHLIRRDTALLKPVTKTALLVFCAVLAFLPSSFYGAVALGIAPDWVGRSPLLFSWGLVSGMALVTLLIGSRLFGEKAYRYDNIARICGMWRAVRLFLVEFGVLISSLVFIAGFANVVDGGFRSQLGIAGSRLGGIFLDRQGSWSPEVRGLMIILLGLGIVAVCLLVKAETKGHDESVQ